MLRETALRWMTLWQGGGIAGFDVLHAAGFVDHAPAGRGGTREDFRRGILDLHEAFPDFETVVEDLLVDVKESKATIRWTATGHHRATFLGFPPTGARIEFRGIEIIAIDDGQVVERWGEWDGDGIRDQLKAAVGVIEQTVR